MQARPAPAWSSSFRLVTPSLRADKSQVGRRYAAAVVLLVLVGVLMLVGFSGTSGCHGYSWLSHELGDASMLQPYVVLAILAFAGAVYLLASAAIGRREVAVGVAVVAAIAGGLGIWFLAVLEALAECPPLRATRACLSRSLQPFRPVALSPLPRPVYGGELAQLPEELDAGPQAPAPGEETDRDQSGHGHRYERARIRAERTQVVGEQQPLSGKLLADLLGAALRHGFPTSSRSSPPRRSLRWVRPALSSGRTASPRVRR